VPEEGLARVDSEEKGGRHRVKGAVSMEVEVKGFVREVSGLNGIRVLSRIVLLCQLRWAEGRMCWSKWD
jgi:hypothetical protein